MYTQVCELAAQNELTYENRKDIMRRVKVYFGPTRLFEDVFRAALTFTAYNRKN